MEFRERMMRSRKECQQSGGPKKNGARGVTEMVVQTYGYIFQYNRRGRGLTEHVLLPEPLTSDEGASRDRSIRLPEFAGH